MDSGGRGHHLCFVFTFQVRSLRLGAPESNVRIDLDAGRADSDTNAHSNTDAHSNTHADPRPFETEEEGDGPRCCSPRRRGRNPMAFRRFCGEPEFHPPETTIYLSA